MNKDGWVEYPGGGHTDYRWVCGGCGAYGYAPSEWAAFRGLFDHFAACTA